MTRNLELFLHFRQHPLYPLHLGRAWMRSLFVVLEKYHSFMEYFGFETITVFGCKEFCSFKDYGIAKTFLLF